jgi:hypothetical protein
MRIEHIILLAMWVFGVVAFFLFIPHKDRRKGFLAYLIFQAIIWLCDIPAFKYDLLSAPVREMPKATDLPLTIDYFFIRYFFQFFTSVRKQIIVYGPELLTFLFGSLQAHFLILLSREILIC